MIKRNNGHHFDLKYAKEKAKSAAVVVCLEGKEALRGDSHESVGVLKVTKGLGTKIKRCISLMSKNAIGRDAKISRKDFLSIIFPLIPNIKTAKKPRYIKSSVTKTINLSRKGYTPLKLKIKKNKPILSIQ